jgi:hypothetical protein
LLSFSFFSTRFFKARRLFASKKCAQKCPRKKFRPKPSIETDRPSRARPEGGPRLAALPPIAHREKTFLQSAAAHAGRHFSSLYYSIALKNMQFHFCANCATIELFKIRQKERFEMITLLQSGSYKARIMLFIK